MALNVHPLWKDYYVDLGGQTYWVNYRVYFAGLLFYTGKAERRPDGSNKVRINDIVADFYANRLPDMEHFVFNRDNTPEIVVDKQLSDGSWETCARVLFTRDWSYDYNYDPATMGMSFPIGRRVSNNQWMFYTAFNAENITVHLTFKDGSSTDVVIPIVNTGDFNDDYDFSFAVVNSGSPASGTAMFNLNTWPNLAGISINGTKWEVVDYCARYALYYVNAYGGWDTLLMEGNPKQKDSIKRHSVSVAYNNTNVSESGRRDYLNEIEKTFTLRTGLLDDLGGERMHHLMNAPTVFLYDMVEQTMVPVVISDNAVEYKSFRGNGASMFYYDVNVTVAKDMIRR